MSLALFAPVLEGVQELRIHSCQASQVLGVYLICLLLVGIDEPKFAGVGHQYLVATLLSYPAHPGGVGTRLDCYAHRGQLGGEASSESLWGGTQPTFLDHLAAVLVDEAEG
jgi:hypothetical protein